MQIDARLIQNDLDKLPSGFADAVLEDVLARAAAKAANRAKAKAPSASGTLASSIKPKRIKRAEEWHVVTGQRYAAGLEYGGGHKGEAVTSQRLEALKAWVKVKGLETDPARIARAAWLIGRKIEDEGVAQQKFMEPALAETVPEVLPDLKATTAKALAGASNG